MQTGTGLHDSEALAQPPFPGMVWIPGGTFLMGSDKHYPEEHPAHRVTLGILGLLSDAPDRWRCLGRENPSRR